MFFSVLFSLFIFVAVSNAQINLFNHSFTCDNKMASIVSSDFTHFNAQSKVLVLFKNNEYYVNTKPCDKEEGCKADLKVTSTCSKVGDTTVSASLTTGGAGVKLSAAPSRADPNSQEPTCTAIQSPMYFHKVYLDLDKCVIAEYTVTEDLTVNAISFKVMVADKDCKTNVGSKTEVSAGCVVFNGFGSAVVKDGKLTIYPADLLCGKTPEHGKVALETENECSEYQSGKFAKYVVTDGTATLTYGCSDNACSTSCSTQALEKGICTTVPAFGSMIYGSLGLSGGAIAGIVIGSILGIALVAGIVIVVVKKSGGSSSSAV